jgi:gamma-glutamylcyclotransferase (GGCT)/AIG2-like uncharacterized protein YtfP
MPPAHLYFAYGSMLEPDRLARVAPNARFQKVAHLPETRLYFARANGVWNGTLPTIRPEEGNTVWGALFEVDAEELAAITAAEAADGRVATQQFSVVDREGTRHWVTTHIVEGPEGGEPSHDYIEHVVAGGRHWNLPTGWVINLEEILEDDLL